MTIRNKYLAPVFRGLALAILLAPAAVAQDSVSLKPQTQ